MATATPILDLPEQTLPPALRGKELESWRKTELKKVAGKSDDWLKMMIRQAYNHNSHLRAVGACSGGRYMGSLETYALTHAMGGEPFQFEEAVRNANRRQLLFGYLLCAKWGYYNGR